MLLSVLFLACFGLYQFRVYRVSAMQEETRQAELALHSKQEQVTIEQAKAVQAAAQASYAVPIPTAGMSMSNYEQGCLAALKRAGTINHQLRTER